MPADRRPRLFVVIPVHNRRGFTLACLEHLAAQTLPAAGIVVVDDGSTDGTAAAVRQAHPHVILLRGDGSLWWSGATNLGVECALQRGATHVLCLNDDTHPAPDLLERLLETAASRPGALVGAATFDARSGEARFAGERMNWLTAGIRCLRPEPGRLVAASHAPGRGLLIPVSVFVRLGAFDALRFPQYGADYDFTQRARRAGHPILCDRAARLGVFPEASGDAACRAEKSWRNYARHLFGRRGGGNLSVFFWYTLRHCPPLLLPVSLPVGLLRRLGGYPLEWARERRFPAGDPHARRTT